MSNITTAGGSGPAWKVIHIQDDRGMDMTGAFVKGKTVTYQLRNGKTGTVFVPGATINPDTIRAAVAAEADALTAALNLTSNT